MQLPFQKSHAFLIGINDYQHINPLHTAVNDAKVLAEKLIEEHDYIVHGPLLNPTKKELVHYLETTIKKVVEKNDRILFYFAGHGIALDSEEGPNGYLVPVDAKPGDIATLLDMTRLHDTLTSLPCRHGLLIMDCCFSGAFKWSSGFRDMVFDLPGIIYEQRFNQYLKDPAWQVITSSASDQKAIDILADRSLGFRGNTADQHSPFALALLAGISGAADVIPKEKGDGVITATELYTYLRDVVEDVTMAQSKRQSPSLFSLQKHDKGQYVFLHPRHPFNLPPAPDRNPFMGLKSYDEADANLFYGRDRVINALIKLTNQQQFIVVTGASGTGKSSVIKAGLLPHLRKSDWHILPVIRPGKNPLQSLKDKIPSLLPTVFTTEKSILLIDQYEELITQCLDAQEKIAFEQQLANWLKVHSNFNIIISIRADFEPQFEESILAPWWNTGRYVIPSFSTEELREVIIKPTIQEVLFFEPDSLVENLVDAVNQAPGALPLLSFTLSELYHAYLKSGRTNRALTLEDYEKLGGVIGALRKKADKVYEGLDSTHQNSMRQLMLRMVSIEGGELASKRVLANDLQFPDPQETERVQYIAKQLVAARLVQQGTNSQGEIFIEPAHDALVRAWRRLWEWVKTIGEDKISWQNKLAIAVKDYELLIQENPKESLQLLWHNNPRLDLLKMELSVKNSGLNIQETQFVRQSIKRRTKQKRQFRLGILTFIICLIAASIFSFSKMKEAENQTSITQKTLQASERINRSNNNALKALQLDKTDPTLALRMAATNHLLYPESRSSEGIFAELMRKIAQPKIQSTIPKKHDSFVTTVAFSPDGQSFLTGSWDGTAKVWDLKGNFLHSFSHTDHVSSVAFSPDGQSVLTGSSDTTAKLWNLKGDILQIFRGHQAALSTVVFSPDGQNILTGSKDNTAKLWDLKGHILQSFDEHSGALRVVTFSPDNKKILTVATDTAKLWDLSGNLIHTFQKFANTATFSPDGKKILTAGYTIDWWDLKGTHLQSFIRHTSDISAIAFSPDGNNILTIHSGITAYPANLWDLKGTHLQSFIGHKSNISAITFSPDGQSILTGSYDKTAKLWKFKGLALKEFDGHRADINSVAFSPDGQSMLTGSGDKTAKLWAVKGHMLQSFKGHESSINTVAFSPNGQSILTGSNDKTAKLWDLQGNVLQSFPKHESAVKAAVFSPDGQSILTGSSETKLWNLQGQLLQSFKEPTNGSIDAVAFSPDGQHILTKSNGTANLWDIKGNILRSFKESSLTVGIDVVAFSPDGKHILTGSNDRANKSNRMAKLWDLEGNILQTFQGHNGYVYAVAFSPSGQHILTGSSDNTAKLWDLKGNLLQTFQGHISDVKAVAFSPDGQTILTGSKDRNAKLWLNPFTFLKEQIENYSKEQLKEEGLEFTEADWAKKKNVHH